MINEIRIEGMRIYAYHGCNADEAVTGSAYHVDVVITTDFTGAADSDDLARAIDYCAVYDVCRREMSQRSKLIEHACKRMYQALRTEFPAITRLRVSLAKLSPPINGDVERVAAVIEG